MRDRKIIIGFVGATQETIGVLSIVFSYVLYHNLFDVRTWLNVPEEYVSLYLLLLLVFGFISSISGFFLLRELLK